MPCVTAPYAGTSLSVVVPCFNEQDVLTEFFEHLRDARAALKTVQQMKPTVIACKRAASCVRPVPRLAGAAAHRVQPRRGNAEIGLGLDTRFLAQ